MALKLLALKKNRDNKAAELTKLRNKRTKLLNDEKALTAEVEAAETISPELQTRVDDLTRSQTECDESIINLTAEIEAIDEDIRSMEDTPGTETETPQKRSALPSTGGRTVAVPEAGSFRSQSRCFRSRAARDMFYARSEVKEFLANIRSMASAGRRSVQGAELTIPTVMLELIRDNLAERSKLIRFVLRRELSGPGRQNIAAKIPEAVWTEACAAINELELVFNQVEVDGFKVGGFIAICNATIDDSDVNLGEFIVDALLTAIGIAIDKAIVYGKGRDKKMPVGFVTRLAQQSQPSYWGPHQGTWTDLHTSNMIKLDLNAKFGVEFFVPLLGAMGKADPRYAYSNTVWCMNRKTHMDLMARGLAFNSAGTLVAGLKDRMPVENGEIVELEWMPDFELAGGFLDDYLLAERAGATIAQSTEVRFLEEQTVYKGTARYDGTPIYGEGFVVINYNNVEPTTEIDFAANYANAKLNTLICTAAAGGASGKTKVTVAGQLDTSKNTLAYKVQSTGGGITAGSKVEGFEELKSGTTAIEAATGTPIAIVELDADKCVVSLGTVLAEAQA